MSIATISKYLNGGNVLEKNKQLIEEGIKVLDYRINEMARGLKTNKTMTVGVLIPSLENIFFTTIISNIENTLIQNRYGMIVCDYRESVELEEQKLDFLLNKNVDGIILVSNGKDEQLVKSLLEKKIPVILLDRMIKGIECDAVMADNLNAAYDATEQLFIRKHKRIGIICGPNDSYTSQERYKGYIRVHQDYGYDIDYDLIKYGDYSIESGYELLLHFYNMKERPSAVFVTNYEMTIGAIMAINDNNIKVPEELSIIGFDNIHLAKLVKPSLAVVVQPMKQIGEEVAKLMLKRLKDDYTDFPTICRLKTEILLNESIQHKN